ncbi:MAG: amidohydrolase [Chloroflexota bacterium]|nr:amidohydrolase [Chloroflexota bacterium]
MRLVEADVVRGVDAVFALHCFSDMEVGNVGVRAGPVCAAVDNAYVTIHGQGAHGAHPHLSIDPIHLAAQVITGLHAIVSRRVRPIDPAVITVGTIHGGTAANVIPEEMTFSITIRSFDPGVRQTLHRGIARALGGDYDLRIVEGYPTTVNDEDLTGLVGQVGEELLGADQVFTIEPTMGAEDFSCYLAQAPGCFFRLGTGFPGEEPRVGHIPRFDIDERALPIGAAMLAAVARRYLGAK